LAAKPPLLPFASVIELIVTVFPVPAFLLLNVVVLVDPIFSEPTIPVKVNVFESFVPPSYVLLDSEAVAVNSFCTMIHVVVD